MMSPAFLVVLCACIVSTMAAPAIDIRDIEEKSMSTDCKCTRKHIECCSPVQTSLTRGYGKKQYRINDHERLSADTTKDNRKFSKKYYMCTDGKCVFYNMKGAPYNDTGEHDDSYTNGVVRRKRSSSDTCCDVETAVVEVRTVGNVDESDDVWFAVLDDSNQGPTFVTKTCKGTKANCAMQDSVCRTVQDIHGVLVYKYIFTETSIQLETAFVPVIFNVGCECQAVPPT